MNVNWTRTTVIRPPDVLTMQEASAVNVWMVMRAMVSNVKVCVNVTTGVINEYINN